MHEDLYQDFRGCPKRETDSLDVVKNVTRICLGNGWVKENWKLEGGNKGLRENGKEKVKKEI